MTASKVMIDERTPTNVTMEGTITIADIFYGQSPHGKILRGCLDALGVEYQELPESQRSYWGLAAEGDADAVRSKIGNLQDSLDDIAQKAEDPERRIWGGAEPIVTDYIASLQNYPNASFMMQMGMLAGRVGRDEGTNDGVYFLYGLSGTEYARGLGAKHENRMPMYRFCHRDIGGLVINSAGIIVGSTGHKQRLKFLLDQTTTTLFKVAAEQRNIDLQAMIAEAIEAYANTDMYDIIRSVKDEDNNVLPFKKSADEKPITHAYVDAMAWEKIFHGSRFDGAIRMSDLFHHIAGWNAARDIA